VSIFQKLYRGDTHFDLVGNRRRWFTLSAVLVTVAILALLVRGLNLSVDFVGGSLVEMENPAGASVADVREVLGSQGLDDARVQTTGGGGLVVQTGELELGQEDLLVEELAAIAGVDPGDVSRQTVGPTFGSQITRTALRALIVFLIVVAVFISWRLAWKMSAAALLALGHDLIITAGIYALVGFQVTPETVIAILTIMGYSLYDTVVVFDKVLENEQEAADRSTYSSIINKSMNQVLMRSINTSLTSLLPIGSLLFVGSFLLGATTLREFALALFIGVAAGTYSSIFLASPVLAVWKERESHWQRVRTRAARRVGEEDEYADHLSERAAAEDDVDKVVGPSGAVPRPPKQRRRRR